MSVTRNFVIAAATAAMLAAAGPLTSAEAACVKKAGQGTNTTLDGAKFQAWEAVLQATSWGMWGNWMSSSQKVGKAPGYKVSNFRSKCKKGVGLGYQCVLQAKLCN